MRPCKRHIINIFFLLLLLLIIPAGANTGSVGTTGSAIYKNFTEGAVGSGAKANFADMKFAKIDYFTDLDYIKMKAGSDEPSPLSSSDSDAYILCGGRLVSTGTFSYDWTSGSSNIVQYLASTWNLNGTSGVTTCVLYHDLAVNATVGGSSGLSSDWWVFFVYGYTPLLSHYSYPNEGYEIEYTTQWYNQWLNQTNAADNETVTVMRNLTVSANPKTFPSRVIIKNATNTYINEYKAYGNTTKTSVGPRPYSINISDNYGNWYNLSSTDDFVVGSPPSLGPGAVNVTGYVVNGYTGSVIDAANVNASQEIFWFNTTSGLSGDYLLGGIDVGSPIYFNETKSGYRDLGEWFTPSENTTYHLNLTMLPDYVPNNTAILGFTYTTWSHNTIAGATVTIQNSSWSDTDTSSAAGFYMFDDLLAGSVYNVSATAPSHQNSAIYDVTTVSEAIVQQDINLDADYILTVYARDAATGALLTGVDVFIQLSDGQYTNTSFGSTTFHVDGGLFTVTGTADGYTAAQQQAVVSGDSSVTLLLSKTGEQSQVSYYTQKVVRIRAVDAYGVPLVGANISVNYIASTLPSTNTTWLVSAFGISQQVAIEMTTSSIAMTGFTAFDGAINFVMFPALTYGITITNTTLGLSHYTTLAPQDNDYTIYCALSTQNAPNSTQLQFGNTSLFITEPNMSFVTFNMIYYDASGLTTNLKYYVWCWDNQTEMYYVDYGDPGISVIADGAYTVPNVKGQEWRFWYNATRSAPI